MRLDKFVCKSTRLTRCEAQAQILAGQVSVNGQVATSAAMQVHENNCITLNGQPLIARPSQYIMLHKPANTLCSNIDGDYPSVFRYLPMTEAREMHIAGRLDADTTGLVLITDDGRWSFTLFNPRFACQKIYRVDLRDPLDCLAFHRIEREFNQGIMLPGESQLTRAATMTQVSSQQVLLRISEGRYHQVKRMFALVGNKVTGLHRQQIGEICLDVPAGQWRHLSAEEVASVIIGTEAFEG
ncbi:pseudouridine synthase [Shewanella sp. NIFS-20-20]|uniref:pseudouridine synthase n=1 Tax=Shewanella sp. NIFS-20-20 TaxID=2853806 RepID=UPI001C43CAAB|nr:pseudouridine synthase [Shewanella sp. NIFS-20-20]MBV7317114.1 pseudouridine synthase [Shewanella sp. NIFS-20-20]